LLIDFIIVKELDKLKIQINENALCLNLANLCQVHNIPLNHHDALSDAKACAALYLRSLKNK
jgi:hypothetical protein